MHALAVLATAGGSAAGGTLLAVFPFAMELVVVVLFAVVGFPIWLLSQVVQSVRESA